MQVTLEHTRTICDHCGELGQSIILHTEFANEKNDSIQLCHEHARYFASEILKSINPKENEL